MVLWILVATDVCSRGINPGQSCELTMIYPIDAGRLCTPDLARTAVAGEKWQSISFAL